MCAVCETLATFNPNIDGLFCGTQWAVTTLTYSFPTSGSYYGSTYGYNEPTNNFQAFTAKQQAVVRKALDMYSAVSELTFVQSTETATQHADIRFAQSAVPPTAWAYYPKEIEIGGDVWFGDVKGYYTNPVKGNYAFYTTIHEIGHAMGLKHPHEAMALGQMPLDYDQIEYTVMSYRSYEGADPTKPLTIETYGYAQSLMMYDIAAIQHMYGADFGITTDTVYSWSATTGEEFINGVGQGAPGANRILMTVWAGHSAGTITYDFSNYSTALNVNLQPGAWTTTSSVQLSNLGNGHFADGNIANALLCNNDTRSLVEIAKGGAGSDTIIGNTIGNTLYGNAGNDKLYGLDGNDKLIGGAGNDYLDGGNGTDTAIFSGNAQSYHWVNNQDGTWSISGLDGNDTLKGIEQLQFADQTITIQAPEVVVVTGNGGSVDSALISTVSENIKAILRVTPTTDAAAIDASLLSSGLTHDAYLAQLIAKAHDSTIPGIIVYDAVFDTTPGSAHLDGLAAFVSSQIFSPGYQATNDPRLGGYEAMGRGLSETSQFATKYSQSTDAAFISTAYHDAFGVTVGSAQASHFQDQIDYFEQLYASVGVSADQAQHWARGAVLGQMIGFASEAGSALAHAAENYLLAVANGTSTYGVSLMGSANFADAHMI